MNSSAVDGTASYPKCLHVRNSFDYVPDVYFTLILSCSFNCILGVISVAGNTLILFTIKRTPSLHTPSYCILFNLAAADVCVGLIAQPLFVIFKAYELKLSPLEPLAHQKDYFEVYCVFGVLADGFGLMLSLVSGITLALVSVEKYLAIVLHLRYVEIVTNSRIIRVVIGIWVFAVSLIVWLFTTGDRHIKYITIFISTLFILVFLLVIFCNVKIGLILRKHKKQIGTANQAQQQNSSHVASITKFKKSVASMAYVMLLYLLCYVPHGVTMLVKGNRNDYKPISIYRAVNITVPLVFLNSSLNPLLYCWRFRDIQCSAVAIIKKLFSRSDDTNS